ncbi:MAG: hypothetical protein MUO76_21680 [Anaerolineaceae bacterium]|nr:hypothetical protein [Anaerolineaceae bacterium]
MQIAGNPASANCIYSPIGMLQFHSYVSLLSSNEVLQQEVNQASKQQPGESDLLQFQIVLQEMTAMPIEKDNSIREPENLV